MNFEAKSIAFVFQSDTFSYVSLGSKIDEFTSCNDFGTSKLKTGTVLVSTFSIEPSRIASIIARVSFIEIRAIIDAILDGSIENADTKMVPVFNLEVPTSLHDVNSSILDPRDTYENVSDWNTKAIDLASKFIKNFEQYTDNEQGQSLVKAGPQL